MSGQRIVAVGLLTQRDLDILGRNFDRAFPIDETPSFDALLQAIDQAERDLRSAKNDASQEPPGGPGARFEQGSGARSE